MDEKKLTKYIRPATMGILIIIIFILAICDKWLNIRDIYVNIFGNAFYLIIGFYVSSRGIEKIVDKIKGNTDKKV